MASRILLVDDEPDILEALRVRILSAGFDCQTARNGREGLELVARWHPDLVIADLLMPEVNGYELVKQLKANPATAAIPIIVVTAVPEYSRQQRAQDLAGARVLSKPFDSRTLLTNIRDLLRSGEGGPPHG